MNESDEAWQSAVDIVAAMSPNGDSFRLERRIIEEQNRTSIAGIPIELIPETQRNHMARVEAALHSQINRHLNSLREQIHGPVAAQMITGEAIADEMPDEIVGEPVSYACFLNPSRRVDGTVLRTVLACCIWPGTERTVAPHELGRSADCFVWTNPNSKLQELFVSFVPEIQQFVLARTVLYEWLTGKCVDDSNCIVVPSCQMGYAACMNPVHLLVRQRLPSDVGRELLTLSLSEYVAAYTKTCVALLFSSIVPDEPAQSSQIAGQSSDEPCSLPMDVTDVFPAANPISGEPGYGFPTLARTQDEHQTIGVLPAHLLTDSETVRQAKHVAATFSTNKEHYRRRISDINQRDALALLQSTRPTLFSPSVLGQIRKHEMWNMPAASVPIVTSHRTAALCGMKRYILSNNWMADEQHAIFQDIYDDKAAAEQDAQPSYKHRARRRKR